MANDLSDSQHSAMGIGQCSVCAALRAGAKYCTIYEYLADVLSAEAEAEALRCTNLTSVQYILLITDHRSLKSVQYMQCASVCLKVERRATRRDWSAARRATVII